MTELSCLLSFTQQSANNIASISAVDIDIYAHFKS